MSLSKQRNRERMRIIRGSKVKTIGPADIADVAERRAFLTTILRQPLPEYIPVHSMILASDQLNKLDRLYGPETPIYQDNRTQILVGFSMEQLRSLSQELRALLEVKEE